MNNALPTTKTIAKTSDELGVGDRVKFGKDDFRTIKRIDGYWIVFDATTVPRRAYWQTPRESRKVWRVVA